MLLDTIRLSLKNLGRKRSRSLLTILGIAIGVASVVLIASIGDIGKNAVDEELGALGVGGVMLSGSDKVAAALLGEEHLAAIRESGVVEQAVPIVADYTKSYMRGLMLDAVVWGIDAGASQVIALDVLHGRLITERDVESGRKVCLVDQNIARAYYKRDNIVGKTLTLQFRGAYEEFEVVGVAASGGSLMQGLMGDVIPSFVYLPYPLMQSLTGKQSFDQIAVGVSGAVDGDVAGEQLVSLCERISGVETGYRAENMQSQKQKLDGVLDTVTLVLSAIAGVSLVVAGLSIMTVMLQSVGERTREIGIKKSIGAGRRDILLEFLVEALTISVLGSLLGAAFGMAVAAAGCVLLGVAVRLSVRLILFSVCFSVLVGVVFGVYPASLAAKLRPVDALMNSN